MYMILAGPYILLRNVHVTLSPSVVAAALLEYGASRL